MEILPIRTPRLDASSDLASELKKADIRTTDIIVISSKAIATCEGAAIDLSAMKPSAEAEKYAKITGQQPEFLEAVIQEAKRMNGHIVGTCPSAVLTLLRPNGMKGIILCPNAGLDLSNTKPGTAIGWPHDPVVSAKTLSKQLGCPVIIADSACPPTRRGVTAFALSCVGVDPIRDERGRKDLYGKELRITQEAIADQLATAANAVMGNAGQSTPAAILRDHGIAVSNFAGWIDGMEPSEDIFKDVLRL